MTFMTVPLFRAALETSASVLTSTVAAVSSELVKLPPLKTVTEAFSMEAEAT